MKPNNDYARPVLDLRDALEAISCKDSWTEQKVAFQMHLTTLQVTNQREAYECLYVGLLAMDELLQIIKADEPVEPLDETLHSQLQKMEKKDNGDNHEV